MSGSTGSQLLPDSQAGPENDRVVYWISRHQVSHMQPCQSQSKPLRIHHSCNHPLFLITEILYKWTRPFIQRFYFRGNTHHAKFLLILVSLIVVSLIYNATAESAAANESIYQMALLQSLAQGYFEGSIAVDDLPTAYVWRCCPMS
jgi:hypothetical protein